MANYNPHSQQVIGEEWVPIRDEDQIFSPAVNAYEAGYTFTTTASRTLSEGRFYVNDIPNGANRGQVMAVAVYPAGREAWSGPITTLEIPVNSCAISGNVTLVDSSEGTATNALMPGNNGLSFDADSGAQLGIIVSFAINKYPVLLGKRILNIQLNYIVRGNDTLVGPGVDGATAITLADSVSITPSNGSYYGRINAVVPLGVISPDKSHADLGEINAFAIAGAPTGAGIFDRMHWNFAQLARLDTNLANPLRISFLTGTGVNAGAPASSFLDLKSVTLSVTYCEEQRVAYGAVQLGQSSSTVGRDAVIGAQQVTLRQMDYTANPVLAAGTYTAVLSSPYVGKTNGGFDAASNYPLLNALRELYDIPSMPGVQVNLPFPVINHNGDTFTREQVHIIPQLTLHTSGGVINESHVYGRQGVAQVYGTLTATQLMDTATGSFGQVRYYARRFGDTAVNLLLSSPDITGAGMTATLTPAEWDALPEILDGWKEITKRFATAAAFTGAQSRWTWSAAGENAGNRWEVLSAVAPSVTGVSGNLLTLTSQQLSAATYGQPASGATVDLDWYPGYAPIVSGTTDDPSADAVLLFSVDPPVLSNFTVGLSSQAITGFTECSHGPCCVPSAISYHRVTWSPTTLPTTGFGAYELQRMDPLTGWQTIMLATSPTITGFNDYEARVGVLSSYQIRQTNVLDFAGLWSVTGTGTVTAPGVTLPSCGTSKRGVLIFTSNESQTGAYNLAYAMTWDGQNEVIEDFDFPEAGTIDISRYLDRDYQVAFHGEERGGEQFSRRLLLSNAAVALPRLANMRSLRDMAWADVPYVCVRDDIGDRWFSTVIVGHGEVRRNRRLYNADVTIIETTATASPVNP